MIPSPLPLTIRYLCLRLTTFKVYLFSAGRSRPRHGKPYSSVQSRENHPAVLLVGARVSYEALWRAARSTRRSVGRVSTDQPRAQ
jgi:hypothetical protein